MASGYRVPGMSDKAASTVRERLQERLTALIDTELTLKHIHWNVVGPNFIGVHEMLDPQVLAVREMVDDVAERIATMGGEPVGTPGFVAKNRSWDDYGLGRATTEEHLGALDVVYDGLIADHRRAIEEFDDLDLVSQDVLIEQSTQLEMFQWFVRAHLEDGAGNLPTEGTMELREAAAAAKAERGTRTGTGPKAVKATKATKATKAAKRRQR
jgi:starvation-inducible DNA-binding protein